MKQPSLIIASLCALFLLFSCGEKSALDIDPYELETACDFVDALEAVTDEMQLLISDGELSADEQERFDALDSKGQSIGDVGEHQYELEEVKQCPNWDQYETKRDAVHRFR